MKLKIYNQNCEVSGEMEVPDKFFPKKISQSLIHQVLIAQTNNERQVLAHTKDRSAVGGGRKPWRQKGTGRARQGSIRSPQWRGGGIVFGPLKDRNFSQKVNKKMKRKALAMVLGDKIANQRLAVIETLSWTEYKTKKFSACAAEFEKKIFRPAEAEQKPKAKAVQRSLLIVNAEKDNEKIKFSARNLTGLKLISADNLNIYDLLKYQNLLIGKAVLADLAEKFVSRAQARR